MRLIFVVLSFLSLVGLFERVYAETPGPAVAPVPASAPSLKTKSVAEPSPGAHFTIEGSFTGKIDTKWIDGYLKGTADGIKGFYRYDTSESDLDLVGRATQQKDKITFSVDETNEQGTLTGRWVGTLNDSFGIEGSFTWTSPDGKKSSKGSLHYTKNSIVKILPLTDGISLISSTKNRSKVSRDCRDLSIPRLTGFSSAREKKRINELLETYWDRKLLTHDLDCDSAPSPDRDIVARVDITIGKVARPLVAIMTTAYEGAMSSHFDEVQTTCDLIDYKTGVITDWNYSTHLDVKTKLRDIVRKDLLKKSGPLDPKDAYPNCHPQNVETKNILACPFSDGLHIHINWEWACRGQVADAPESLVLPYSKVVGLYPKVRPFMVMIPSESHE